MAEKKEYCAILETDSDKLGINEDEKKSMYASAYNDLLLVIIDDEIFYLVDEVDNIDYPEGDTRTAWERTNTAL